MAYRLTPGQPISLSVRQVGVDQIDRVLSQFAAKGEMAGAVHDARKSMKRLRALLHLIRPAMKKGQFRRNEARLKRIARSLAGPRDAQAMLERVEKLAGGEAAEAHAAVFEAFRKLLAKRRQAAETAFRRSGTADLHQWLSEAREAFEGILLDPDSFGIIAGTLEKDYRRTRRAFAAAYRHGEDEAFHDWRKQVQRHWRQLLLIAPSWPKAIRPHIALARELSEVLGEDHDLSVLAGLACQERAQLGDTIAVDAYIAFLRERQSTLRDAARLLGTRLLAEKPRSFAHRISAYWEAGEASDADMGNGGGEASGNIIVLSR